MATAPETQTVHAGSGECVDDERLVGEWARGEGGVFGKRESGIGGEGRGAANRQKISNHKRRRRHTENVEDKVLGYMTGTGESLTDAQSHGHTHMEAGGATLGFTVL